MKKDEPKKRKGIKDERFPRSVFFVYLGVLLLMAGLHTNVIVVIQRLNINSWLMAAFPILYWLLVAAGLTIYTRKQIRNTFEIPMQNLADATKKVAEGDFSVYVPAIHTADKLDYLDFMILDFNKMVEELGSVETLKTDFVSNVSHEMKTPIAVIKNYAELLSMEKVSDQERREYGKNIEEAALRLSSLISNILRLNKLENQKIDVQMERYNLGGQLEEYILQYEEMWDEKELELAVNLEENAVVCADRELLGLVWNNLLSNAVKFTEKGGSVEISLSTGGGDIEVSVADTGCGISEESLRHVFDKFYQGDTSHAKEGNGLGLALVKRVIELMNGEIRVESRKGVGSIFTVRLPQAEKMPETTAEVELD